MTKCVRVSAEIVGVGVREGDGVDDEVGLDIIVIVPKSARHTLIRVSC